MLRRTILTDRQREALFALPVDDSDLPYPALRIKSSLRARVDGIDSIAIGHWTDGPRFPTVALKWGN